MLDKAIILTTIFTIVDDTMKGSAVIQQALKRPGPAPHLSDSELITIALYQELIGEPREDHFFRLHQASLLSFFPRLNERSLYNRRTRIAAKVTAHSVGMMVNTLLGRPALHSLSLLCKQLAQSVCISQRFLPGTSRWQNKSGTRRGEISMGHKSPLLLPPISN